MITEDRIKHMLAVARKCEKLAKEKFNMSGEKQKVAFVIGLLHDIGYEYTDAANHEVVGAVILEMAGFGHYSDIIRYHGFADTELRSTYLDVLNIADLTTSNKGEDCTVEDRIRYIESVYGDNSFNAINAKKLSKQLGLID